MVLSDNGKTSRYTYNAAGERIMKSYGTMEGVYINGAPQGITFHETDNFTLYPASIISINKNRFTKHYFIGDKRIASRIGTGLFNNVYGRNGSYVTAGQQDYAERMNQIQKQKEAYYKQQGIAPGVPTEKGAYGDPENTGVGYNAVLSELGNHDVPQGWIQTPRPNTTPNTNPGPPVSWNDPSNPDDPQAGYGYIANDTTREETFFYHSDHLGSTSYITDDKANITQYDAYVAGRLVKGVGSKGLQKASNRIISSKSSLSKVVRQRLHMTTKRAQTIAKHIQKVQKSVARHVRKTVSNTVGTISSGVSSGVYDRYKQRSR